MVRTRTLSGRNMRMGSRRFRGKYSQRCGRLADPVWQDKRPRTSNEPLNEDVPDEDKEERRPKRKVACMIGYCGHGYSGMQLNPPAKTIEGDLFDAFVKAGAISKANSDDPKKVGPYSTSTYSKSSFLRAARTDKGVHAAGNLVSLKLIIEDSDIVEKINSHLSASIRLWGFVRTINSFACRRMCDSRSYEYLIPSHVFISPSPSSVLWRRIIDHEKVTESKRTPDNDFWGILKALQADLKADYDEERDKKQKALELEKKREYRIPADRLERVRAAFILFEGTHNFHNYTIGKAFTDASCQRHMKSITVSDPKHVGETEWLSIKVHGQSFMLHQIRKMVAMAVLVVRTQCPLSHISDTFGSVRISIPKAPGLGLLLERPIFDGYNRKAIEHGKLPIDFSKYSEAIDNFKAVNIYDRIFAEEAKENVYGLRHGIDLQFRFFNFFSFIDAYTEIDEFSYLTDAGVQERKSVTKVDGAEMIGGENEETDNEITEETEG